MKLTDSQLSQVDEGAFSQQRKERVLYKQPGNKYMHSMDWRVERQMWNLKYITRAFLAIMKSRFSKHFVHREYRFVKEK